MPPAWKPYVFQFQLPPLDVTPGPGGLGPEINKLDRSPVITTRCHKQGMGMSRGLCPEGMGMPRGVCLEGWLCLGGMSR